MTDSADSVRGPRASPAGQTPVSTRLSRYDLLLSIIPFAFVVALLASELFSVPPAFTLAVASLVGVGAIVDGVVRNPPVSAGH